VRLNPPRLPCWFRPETLLVRKCCSVDVATVGFFFRAALPFKIRVAPSDASKG